MEHQIPKPHHFISRRVWLLIILFIATALFSLFYASIYLPLSSKVDKLTHTPSVTPKACTEEAKICPDGSSVMRTGPECEFTQCPTTLKKEEID